MFTRLREKQGLCYATYPVHHDALEGGFWGLYVASGYDKVDEAEKILNNIINNLKNDGLTKKDFEIAKTMIEGKELLHLQTNGDYANVYSLTTLYEFPLDYYHKELQNIRDLPYKVFQKDVLNFLIENGIPCE